MKLSLLLGNTEVKSEFTDVEICGITNNTNEVKKGFLYACIRGENADGHDFAEKALQKGAVAILTDHTVGISGEVVVSDTLIAYSNACYAFYGNPQNQLKLIGVTGTNGKTSTCKIIKKVLSDAGIKCGLAGTISNETGDKEYPSSLTTPDASEMASLLREMADNGCEYAVMEVSSHALKQQRVYPCKFEIAVFTNLTQDHLDYHKTMQDYLESKKRLFYAAEKAVMNIDDQYFGEMSKDIDCPVFTYGIKNRYADFKAENIVSTEQGIRYELLTDDTLQRINFSTPGTIYAYNTLAAISVLSLIGIPISKSAVSVKEMQGIKGRMELVPTERDFNVIIDYAHTPDGLFNTVKTVKEFTKGRLITLFGCGGDRDSSKRAEMGRIASAMSDITIITSDNPRTEPPMDIINDILKGVSGQNYIVIENREEAIKKAINTAQKDDIVLLAGKGHEEYQILGKTKIHFDEREIVRKYLDII